MPHGDLTLGHSPDPDDAFMFYGLAKGLVPTGDFRFKHILQDIQTLNERATRGELDISAVSIHAYAYVSDKYALLPCGASMGDRYGPMVVARGGMSRDELAGATIAVPGLRTTAYLALGLCLGAPFSHLVVPFDKILDAVAAGLRRRFGGLTRVVAIDGTVQEALGAGLVRRAGMVFLATDNRAGRLAACRLARLAGVPDADPFVGPDQVALEGLLAGMTGGPPA